MLHAQRLPANASQLPGGFRPDWRAYGQADCSASSISPCPQITAPLRVSRNSARCPASGTFPGSPLAGSLNRIFGLPWVAPIPPKDAPPEPKCPRGVPAAWHPDFDQVQPVIQIFAEPPLFYRQGQISGGQRDDARLNTKAFLTARRSKTRSSIARKRRACVPAVSAATSSRTWCFWRPVRSARLPLRRAGKRAALVPEEFALSSEAASFRTRFLCKECRAGAQVRG